MLLRLTLEQYTDIKNQLPKGICVGYQENDEYLLNTNDVHYIYEILSPSIEDLYSKTIENFYTTLPRKYSASQLRIEGQGISDKFIQRNIDEGINDEQSVWLLSRASQVSMFLMVGAIGDAAATLQAMEPDDMTESFHWITQDRINNILQDITEAYSRI
jgi:hypothetical protein